MSGKTSIWRRLRWLAFIALVLVVLVRLSLTRVLSAVARSLAADFGLELSIGDIDLAVFGGRIQVWKLAASRDGERLFALESLDVDVKMSALFTGNLALRRAEIDGLDVRLERDANGAFSVLGEVDNATDTPEVEVLDQGTARFVLDSLSLPLRVDTARLQRVRLVWRDEAVSPPVELSAELDIALSDLGNPDAEAKLSMRFAAPGAVELVTVEATLATQDDAAQARAELRVTGIEGESIAPYLAAIGLQPPERSQELRVALEAGVRLVGPNQLDGDAKLVQSIGRPSGTGTGTDKSWLELGELGAHFTPRGAGTDIDLVAKGLAFEAERASDGRLVVAGFAIGAASEEPSDAPPTAPAPGPAPQTPAAAPSASALRVARVDVESVRMALVDRAIAAEPLRLELELVRLAATLPPAGPARFDLDLAAPGVFESTHVGADLDLAALAGTASLRVEGLTLERLAPYLAALNLAPSGTASNLEFELAFDGSKDAFDAALTGLALSSGAATPVAIERVAVSGLTANGATSIAVHGVVVHAEAQVDGAVAIGPLRVLPAEVLARPHTEAVPLDIRFDADIGAIDLLAGTSAPLSIAVLAPGLVDDVKVVGRIEATRSSLVARLEATVAGLRPEALARARPDANELPRAGALRFELDVDPHVSGGQSVHMKLLDVDVDQSLLVAEINVTGRIHGADLELAIEARGIAAPDFALSDGHLALGLAVTSQDLGGRVEVRDFVFGDGTSSLELPLVEIDVPRADSEALEIARIAATKVALDVRSRADGSLVVAGLTFGLPDADAAKPTALATASAAPVVDVGSSAASPATEASAPVRPTTAARPWPRISIGAIEFELVRLGIIDEASGREARATARLASTAPWTVFDAAAASGTQTPMSLRFDAALAPGLGGLRCDITLAPDPAGLLVNAEVELHGIDDAGLVAAWPPLGELIAAGGITDGRFHARATARLEAPRSGPTSFDLRRSTGATIEVADVEFVPTKDGPATLALAAFDVQLAPFGAADAPLRAIDVDVRGIRAALDQRPLGLALGGIVLRMPAPSEVAIVEASGAAAAPVVAAQTAEPAPTTGGILIDRMVVSDFVVDFADHTVNPPVFLPIDELELDVRHIAIGTAPRRAAQFRLSLSGGDVELPDPPKDGALLVKLARELKGSNERTQSQRPWFEEFVVSGQVQPGPTPQGWVRTELYGLELTALRGMAEASGVKIGAGTADANVRLDLRGAKGVRVNSRTTFSSLSISEPAGGPISRFLKLPAPLDLVLWALENERSEQIVPLEFSINHSGVSVAELATTASKALVLLIADAIASSPLRVGGSLLDMVGLDKVGLDLFGGDSKPTEGPVLLVPFVDGSTVLDAQGSAAVTAVLALLADNADATVRLTHRFSPNDLALAADLALPAPAECLRLALGLEAERATYISALALKRGRLARLIATGAKAEAEQLTTELRDAAARLVGLEASLDTLYDLSTEPDERARAKRLREAALHLAERRFESFVRDLVARGTQKSLARIQLARPRLGDVAEEGMGAALVVSLRAH